MSRDDLSIALVVAASVVGAAVLYPFWSEHWVVACPMLTLAGIPCLTCGATRAFVAVVRGALGEGLAWNPLAALGALVAIGFVPLASVRVATGRGLEMPRPVAKLLANLGGGRWLAAAALALNWGFLLTRFPR